MKIIWKPITNYLSAEHDLKREKPQAIVIHIGEGNRNRIYSTFLNEEKSSHYCVNNDGTVWQFVKDEDTAWHAGLKVKPTAKIVLENKDKNPNSYTIGIENEGYAKMDIDEQQYQTNAELVLELCEKWAIPLDLDHIIPHRAIRADKTCPGLISCEKIIKLAKELKEKKDIAKRENLIQQLTLLQKILNLLKELAKKVGIMV